MVNYIGWPWKLQRKKSRKRSALRITRYEEDAMRKLVSDGGECSGNICI